MRNKLFALIIFIFCSGLLHGQSLTNKGKDFWLTFLPNYHNNFSDQNLRLRDSLQIYITTDVPTSGKITYRNRSGNAFSSSFSITKSGDITIFRTTAIDYELEGLNSHGTLVATGQNEKPAPQTFHITADNDIAVFALSQAVTTSDAAMILPIQALGLKYTVVAYNSDGRLDYQNSLTGQSTPSQFAVVAVEDNTHISIRPSAATARNGLAQQTVVLQQGEAYLVQANISTSILNADLTGTEVTSDKPVAVFGGQQRATVPIERVASLYSRDMLFEQIPPMESWGTLHIISPLAPPAQQTAVGYDLYRVVAGYDNTAIFINGSQSGILRKGQFLDFPLTAPAIVRTSKPVIVAEYKKTSGDANSSSRMGDPFMVIVPPREQYLSAYHCANIQAYFPLNGTNLPDTTVYYEHYLSIVIPTRSLNSIRVDGNTANTSQFAKVPTSYSAGLCTDMSAGWLRVAHGAHSVIANEPFALTIYGYGMANSYGYTGGISLEKEVDVKPVAASGGGHICLGDSLQLNASGGRGGYSWQPSSSLSCSNCPNPIARPLITTTYKVTSFDAGDCPIADSVTVFVTQAIADASPDTTICIGKAAKLRASGGIKYEWRPAADLSCNDCQNPTAIPSATTKYFVTVTNSNGCSAVDSVIVTVNIPTADAGLDTTICAGNSVQLQAKGGVSYTWRPSADLSCANCPNPIAQPTQTTTYVVSALNNYGCIAEDSVIVTINHLIVDAGRDTIICKGDSVQLQASSGASYSWFPPIGLSCVNCRNPIARPLKTTTYFVQIIDSIGCFAEDSVTIAVSEPHVMQKITETICAGDSIQLSASVGKSYHWSPADGLSCVDCKNPIAFPKYTTTYRLTIDNGPGCPTLGEFRVQVRECLPAMLEFESVVSCDSQTMSISFVNREDTAVQFFGLRSYDADSHYFSVVYNRHLPAAIESGDSVQIFVSFKPKGNISLITRWRFISSADSSRECIIKGSGYIVSVNLSLILPDTASPGSRPFISLYGATTSWKPAAITHFNAFITWHSAHFVFDPSLDTIALGAKMPSDWSVRNSIVEKEDSTILAIYGNGTTAISYDGDIFRFTIGVMLGGTEYPALRLAADFGQRSECIAPIAFGDSLRISTCALPIRYVTGSGKSYYLRTFPLPSLGKSTKIEYGIGISAQAKIELYSLTGQLIATLASAHLIPGNYSIELPHSFLSPGIYYCRIISGEFMQTTPIIIAD